MKVKSNPRAMEEWEVSWVHRLDKLAKGFEFGIEELSKMETPTSQIGIGVPKRLQVAFDRKELIFFVRSILSRREQEVAENICKLIDNIEIGYKNTSLEEWKAFKFIRNSIRDKYVAEKVGGEK